MVTPRRYLTLKYERREDGKDGHDDTYWFWFDFENADQRQEIKIGANGFYWRDCAVQNDWSDRDTALATAVTYLRRIAPRKGSIASEVMSCENSTDLAIDELSCIGSHERYCLDNRHWLGRQTDQ
jgi:hypothetical protein